MWAAGLLFLFIASVSACSKDSGGDADVLPEGACVPGHAWCDGNWLVRCDDDGETLVETPCPGVSGCGNGECKGECKANAGTCQGTVAKVCNGTGTGFYLKPCEPGVCVDGQCGVCYPGTRTCQDEATVAQCSQDGSSMEFVEDCDPEKTKTACFMGTCVSMCAVSPKVATNVGCEYWAVDLDNYYKVDADGVEHDAQNSPFAVVVSNVHETVSADLEVTTFEGYSTKFNVPPGKLQAIELEPRNVDGSLLAPLAYRVKSDIPIIAYQFNPLSNVDVFSNDASMLISSGALGTEYYVMSREQTGDNNRGYVTVVGTAAATEVTVTSSANTLHNEDTGVFIPGGSKTYTLEPYSVLNLETAEFGDDLTGSHIVSDKPVAVFAGSECGNIPNDMKCDQGSCRGSGLSCKVDSDCPIPCCCDHLEEQLLPVASLGEHYVAARSQPRNGEMDYWRILATADGTEITTTPPVAQIPTLNEGDFFEFGVEKSFEIHANHPVMVGQFLAGENAPVANVSECTGGGGGNPGKCKYNPSVDCLYHDECKLYCITEAECEAYGLHLDAGIGDPSFIVLVPVSRFRTEYVFLIPDKYELDYVNIVLLAGARLYIDGNEVDASVYEMVGTGEFRIARSMISDGVHHLTSNRPMGITVYGYDEYVSYGYPAGMTVETLTGSR